MTKLLEYHAQMGVDSENCIIELKKLKVLYDETREQYRAASENYNCGELLKAAEALKTGL